MKKGFTLLELLIVIAIIAILSVIIIIVLNPAETLQKARDSQRLSDLSTIKTALGIYITATSSPQLDGTSGTSNDLCVGGGGADRIWLSIASSTATVTDESPPTGWTASTSWRQAPTVNAAAAIDGTGWIPVGLNSLIGGSPISNMPVDPKNDITNGTSTAADTNNSALMYRYVCRLSPLSFEVNARMESSEFGPGGADDKAVKDGGNNANLVEVGTDLTILPGTFDF